MKIESKYIPILQACLDKINAEMCRLYWNEYQDEYQSPFLNTGNNYENDTFAVRAYYWGDIENLMKLPNFKYKDLIVRWYKHSKRCTEATKDTELTLDFLADMVNDCITSLRKDYGEEDE